MVCIILLMENNRRRYEHHWGILITHTYQWKDSGIWKEHAIVTVYTSLSTVS